MVPKTLGTPDSMWRLGTLGGTLPGSLVIRGSYYVGSFLGAPYVRKPPHVSAPPLKKAESLGVSALRSSGFRV